MPPSLNRTCVLFKVPYITRKIKNGYKKRLLHCKPPSYACASTRFTRINDVMSDVMSTLPAFDSMPFLEKFRRLDSDEQYLCEFNKEYADLMSNVLDMFPDIRWRLKMNPKTGKIEMGADVQSVFDIAWYTFARMVADVAPPVDEDLDYMYSQGSILTCMACGEYFVRHSSRQRYCNNPKCQAERNNRKARTYYKKKKTNK